MTIPQPRKESHGFTCDLGGGRFRLVQPITNSRPGTKLHVMLKDDKGVVCRDIQRRPAAVEKL